METRYILVAEDDSDDQLLFSAALKECGLDFKVDFFPNGEHLVRFLNQLFGIKPRCIFLDLNMPVMNGLETLRCIKSQEQLRNIPVIILSTSNNVHEIAKCKTYGAFDFLVKPDTYGKLVELIKKALHVLFEKTTTNVENNFPRTI